VPYRSSGCEDVFALLYIGMNIMDEREGRHEHNYPNVFIASAFQRNIHFILNSYTLYVFLEHTDRRMPYQLITDLTPSGDQPEAIRELVEGLRRGTNTRRFLA